MVQKREYEFVSDFAKEHLAKGRELGARAEAARLLVRVLVARKLTFDSQALEAKLDRVSSGQLEAWVDRAATADSIDQVFVDD